LNDIAHELIQGFMIHHQKSTLYHPQANGTIEALNKIPKHALTKVCSVQRDNWDQRIPIVIWEYIMTYKQLTKNTPFRLVYGKVALMPLEFVVPSLRISLTTQMSDEQSLQKWLDELMELEED
jgi:hypothetical protein